MDQSTSQMNPVILHSLVNSIKKKKVGVKKRFQASMDNFVNEMFDDMVEQVQEMMPKNLTSTHALQTNCKKVASSSSTLKPKPSQVKKVVPKNEHKFAKLPSTSKLATKFVKSTPKMSAVKSATQPVGSVGQKRTVKSAGAAANDSSSVAINESFDEVNSQVDDDCNDNIIEINKELIKFQHPNQESVYLYLLNNVSVLENDLLEAHKHHNENTRTWLSNHQELHLMLNSSQVDDVKQYTSQLLNLLGDQQKQIGSLVELVNRFHIGLEQLQQSVSDNVDV